jgi:hypothetical protein
MREEKRKYYDENKMDGIIRVFNFKDNKTVRFVDEIIILNAQTFISLFSFGVHPFSAKFSRTPFQNNETFLHTYHSRFIPEVVAEASYIFFRDAHVLP